MCCVFGSFCLSVLIQKKTVKNVFSLNSGQPTPQPQLNQPQQVAANNNNIANTVGASNNNNPANNNNPPICNPSGGLIGGGTSTAAAKNQLEQLNTMREALFSQDGWGCQHVNQDTNWDVPGSPEPNTGTGSIVKTDPSAQSAPSGIPVWKPNINNGTELWETNLRNGGQPPPAPVQKTPWGHTPSTNLGGTWGEDDDGVDSANVWTGAPSNQQAQQWGQQSGSNANVNVNANSSNVASATMWPPSTGATSASNTPVAGNNSVVGTTGPVPGAVNIPTEMKRENEWPSNVNNPAGGNNWGDPRDIRVAGNPNDIRNSDPRDARNPPRFLRIVDPRDPSRDLLRGDGRTDVRGDLRGISGLCFYIFFSFRFCHPKFN